MEIIWILNLSLRQSSTDLKVIFRFSVFFHALFELFGNRNNIKYIDFIYSKSYWKWLDFMRCELHDIYIFLSDLLVLYWILLMFFSHKKSRSLFYTFIFIHCQYQKFLLQNISKTLYIVQIYTNRHYILYKPENILLR